MSSIPIETARQEYGGATDAETLRNMARVTGCSRIYQYSNSADAPAPTDYKRIFSSSDEQSLLSSPHVFSAVLVYDAGRIVNVDTFIRIACTSCKAKLKMKPNLAGKSIKCPKCGCLLKVPPAAAEPCGEADQDQHVEDSKPAWAESALVPNQFEPIHRLDQHVCQVGVSACAFSPTQRILATGDSSDVRLWNVDTGVLIERLRGTGHGSVSAIAFSPDGTRLAFGNTGGSLELWDMKTLKNLWSQRLDCVKCISWSPDGKQLAVGIGNVFESRSGTVVLFEWGTTHQTSLYSSNPHLSVNGAAFAPSGKQLVTCRKETITCWDLPARTARWEHDGGQGEIWSLSQSADGKLLFTGGSDGTIKIWDAASGRQKQSFIAHVGAKYKQVYGLSAPRSAGFFASGGSDKDIVIWQSSGKEALRIETDHNGWTKTVSLSPDGAFLAGAGGTKTVTVWRLSSSKKTKPLFRALWGSN